MTTDIQDIFPYDVLEEFGLTQGMIDDLPEYILSTILSGGRSPLLPIVIKTEDGTVNTYAKFRLMQSPVSPDKLDVIFYPKLKEAKLEVFSEEEKQRLLEGKTILANIDIPSVDGTTHKEECFVQIDPDTNHVFYVHTPVIGRNLRNVDSFLDLSPENMDKLLNGDIIQIDEPEPMTIGIDLFTATGVFVCQGDELNWRKVKDKGLPKYSFGVEGCWVNKDGVLSYVKEEDFDADIEEAFNSTLSAQRTKESNLLQEENTHRTTSEDSEEDNNDEKSMRRKNII
ncbi:MAG: DUF4099 domain-containing protein [Prevotella sp.]|nr:DUF4099 domain-containing protein [Prevotella sp.]